MAAQHPGRTDLYTLTAGNLETFIRTNIQPDKVFLKDCGEAVDLLVNFLQNNAPASLRPREVVKGGSLGKGTAVKGKSDIDLVLMLEQYRDVRTLKRDMETLLDKLKSSLNKYPGVKYEGRTYHCLKVEISKNGSKLSADILPAVNVLDIESSTKVIYEKMGGRDKDIRPFYSPCITPLQINMISQLPPKLKSLIRLVKYWKKETFVDRATRWPTSYVMELVVLHAWTKAGERSDFDMVRGLHAVLTSLVNHKQFRILLDEMITYDKKILPKLEETFIIDPCNPYNDVYDGWAWGNVSALAREWLKKPLFAGVSETSKRW